MDGIGEPHLSYTFIFWSLPHLHHHFLQDSYSCLHFPLFNSENKCVQIIILSINLVLLIMIVSMVCKQL